MSGRRLWPARRSHLARPGEPEDASGGPGPAPGSLRLEHGFFDDYPEFFDTSETSAYPWRLNLRHAAILGSTPEIFEGARVLDIASHDGRWSFAALRAGAREVVGIEARAELVANAEANLARHGLPEGSSRFETGDVFDVLERGDLRVDVVMCLGFLYHTLRHNELFALMARTGARHLVIDTEVIPREEPFIRVTHEWVDRQGNAVADRFSREGLVMTGRPSVAAIRELGWGHGFELAQVVDWQALLRDNPEADHVDDYRQGHRATVLLRAAEAAAPPSPRAGGEHS